MKPYNRLWREKIMSTILYIALFISIFSIGWLGNNIYRDWSNHRTYDGLYLRNYEDKTDTLERANEYDNLGNWVCVNIKGMSFERCVEVAKHECGHAIWAEICEEKNSKLCQEGQELLNKYSNEKKEGI